MIKLTKEEYEYYKLYNRWNPFEASCLLLGLNPDVINQKNSFSNVKKIYKTILNAIKNREKSFRIKEVDGEIQICSIGFINWAEEMGHPIPKSLQIELDPTLDMEEYENIDIQSKKSGSKGSFFQNKRNFFHWKTQPNPRAFFKKNKKVEFNIPHQGKFGANHIVLNCESSLMSDKLKAAIKAYLAVYEGGLYKKFKKKGHTTGIIEWIKDNVDIEFAPNALQEIARNINLNPDGGSPTT